jgi:hypothetical protein
MSGAALHPDLERVALLGWRLAPQTMSRKGFWKGYRQDAARDLGTLDRWAHEYPAANWCVATGPASGVWGLDIDAPSPDHDADGIAAMRALVAEHGPLPPAPKLRSGGGGSCVFFRWGVGSPSRSRTGWPAPGLDIRGPNVVTTLPPSRHRRTGRPYEWLVAPWDLSPPPAPNWLLKVCAPPPEAPKPEMAGFTATTDRAIRRLARACDAVASAAPGTRNATLNRECWIVGGYVGAGLLSEAEAATALYAAARSVGLEHHGAKATVQSGLVAGLKRPLENRG